MTKKLFAVVVAAAFLMVSGCKSTYEKRGDEHLAAKRLKNALLNYNKAEEKGDVSEEFHDNHSLALSMLMAKLVKENALTTATLNYYEALQKKHKDGLLKNAETAGQIAKNISFSGATQVIGADGQVGFIIEGFNNIKLAEEIVKAHGQGGNDVKDARSKAEASFEGSQLTLAGEMDNTVAQEYQLLLGAKLMPNSEKIKEALNAVRLKNRGDFLIFQAAGIDRPSPIVEVNSYVMAFPRIKVGPKGITAELQVWNSSGNNIKAQGEDFAVVSVDGKEAKGKQTSVAKCTSPELDEKTFENKENTFKAGQEMLFINEGKCSFNISFSYGSDFVPNYIVLKNKFGEGRKYLGVPAK